jgi:hypothetical protein
MKELRASIWFDDMRCLNSYQVDSIEEAKKIRDTLTPPAHIHAVLKGEKIIYHDSYNRK